MTQQTLDLHVNPSDETIRVGLLTVRFLLTADNSSGSIAVFELTVPGGQHLLAPAHSHDHYEEAIYGIDGALTWTVDGRQIEVDHSPPRPDSWCVSGVAAGAHRRLMQGFRLPSCGNWRTQQCNTIAHTNL